MENIVLKAPHLTPLWVGSLGVRFEIVMLDDYEGCASRFLVISHNFLSIALDRKRNFHLIKLFLKALGKTKFYNFSCGH